MTFLSIIVALKTAGVTPPKKGFALKRKSSPEKGLLWRTRVLPLLILQWCSKYFCNKQE